MDKLDFQSNAATESISSAKKILFGLCAFSIVAIYIAIFSAYNIQEEIFSLRMEKEKLSALQNEGKSSLAEIRGFYEGPAEADKINFSSFIYALDITRHNLDNTVKQAEIDTLSIEDKSFFLYQSDLIDSNSFELYSIMKGLIDQKQKRIGFDQLTIPDLLDLDYHKGKGAWDLYYEWSSLRYALYTAKSYGYKKLPESVKSLEQRYMYFLEQSMKTRSSNTLPKKKGRDPNVTEYLEKLSNNGFHSIGDLSRKLIHLGIDIEKEVQQSENVLKLPFVDQNVGFDSLVWVIPLTILSALLFVYFYLLKAKQALSEITKDIGDSSYITRLYVWAALPQLKHDYRLFYVATLLRGVIFGLPLFISSYLVLRSDFLKTIDSVAGAILTMLSFFAVYLCAKELSTFRNIHFKDSESNKTIQPKVTASAD